MILQKNLLAVLHISKNSLYLCAGAWTKFVFKPYKFNESWRYSGSDGGLRPNGLILIAESREDYKATDAPKSCVKGKGFKNPFSTCAAFFVKFHFGLSILIQFHNKKILISNQSCKNWSYFCHKI